MHALLHSVPPTPQQATINPHLCQRLLDTHGQVWVSLLWSHFSFILGPGAHKVLFVPSKSLFPQSCSGSSMVGLMATSSKRAYAIPRCTQSPCPCSSPIKQKSICMQVKKQQLELDIEQQTGFKLGKEYIKAVYCLPAYLTYMQSTS